MVPDITPHIAVVRVFRPLIPLSETFSVMEAHRLSQGDARCHRQMARTVGKAGDTSHLTPLPKSNLSPASYAIIFLKSRDSCWNCIRFSSHPTPPQPTCPFTLAVTGFKLAAERNKYQAARCHMAGVRKVNDHQT